MLGYLVDRSCLSVGTPSRYVEGCIVGISLLLVSLFLFPFCSRSIHRYTAIAARCLGSFSKELLEISLLDIKPPFNGPLIQIGFSNFFPASISPCRADQRPKRSRHFCTRLGEASDCRDLIRGASSGNPKRSSR